VPGIRVFSSANTRMAGTTPAIKEFKAMPASDIGAGAYYEKA
jgi:hypothetical protein